jgi:EAL domain-containing protein (putative c-di-GMP-specific phosphodiesterase class I)
MQPDILCGSAEVQPDGTFQVRSAAWESAASWRQVRHDLRQATHDRAFELTVQPRVSLKGGALCAVQAQLRWPRRRGGRSAAGALAPLLDECGVADDVTAWVLGATCRVARNWPDVPVCVAVPDAALRHGSLLAHVGKALDASGLASDQLTIDLAGAALAGADDGTLLTLAALRDLGVGLALDDFGGVAACLMTLQRLPLTMLKLDRQLVRDLPASRDAAALAGAATSFAHALGMTVVACGVETELQRTALRRAGCDQAQGSLCGSLSLRRSVAGLDGKSKPKFSRNAGLPVSADDWQSMAGD